MKTKFIPTEIRRSSTEGLFIMWGDGINSKLGARLLRENCPCASCREKRGDTSHQAPLTGKPSSLRIIESSLESELRLERIWPVGNYALGLEWGDGHSSGIYTFEYLRELSQR